MYAVIRVNSFDPDKLARSRERLQQFHQAHAAQRGYGGSLVIELEDGRHFAVNLWESEADSAAAFSALGPKVGPLLSPLMTRPSELVGVGNVIRSDLARASDT